jgi:hypothetical protein
VTSCVGTKTRTIVTCQDGGCVDSDETQDCMVLSDTKCGDDKCCGAAVDNYPGCNGACGSPFLKLRCDGLGTCQSLCEYVACWGTGCGTGGVTKNVACP